MPSNDNPFPLGHSLHELYENADAAQRSALRGDPLPPEPVDRQDFTVPTIGNTAHSLAEDPYAATSWGKPVEQDLTCPSGQLCRVRKVDVIDLLGDGMLNNADFLSSIANQLTPGSDKKAAGVIAENAKNMEGFKEVMRKVVTRIVLKPKLHMPPEDDNDRVDGLVYIDTVNLTDQIHIFNWAITGKEAEELQQFRQPTGQSVGDVETIPVVSPEAIELPGDNASA